MIGQGMILFMEPRGRALLNNISLFLELNCLSDMASIKIYPSILLLDTTPNASLSQTKCVYIYLK